MEPDFSGYATKAGLKCSDGRTITPEAFKHMNGQQVPLVWQHGHNSPDNILGHAVLEVVPDGVRAHGFFNDTKQGVNAKALVLHNDINKLSIYANQLVEKTKVVHHGNIREVSLVLAGANPGAKIDYVRIQHSADPDDVTELDDEAIIHSGELLDGVEKSDESAAEGEAETEETVEHAAMPAGKTKPPVANPTPPTPPAADSRTVQEIYDGMSEEEQNVLHYMLGAALKAANVSPSDNSAQHSGDDDEGIAHQEGNDDMARNVFEQNAGKGGEDNSYTLTHEDVKGIVADGMKRGSLAAAAEAFALQHGIENIDVLFPDAKTIDNTPELLKRRTEWVATVLNGTRHTPFSRIKTITADLTQDEARAKGYIKGSYKLEEWFGVTKRTTTPTTIYKKQKIDRDDMLDITDFDIVAFLKGEMRVMLEEEIARAILIGDGRQVSDEDKVKDPLGASDGAGIRSILNDHELFVTTVNVNVDDAGSSYDEVVDGVMDGMEFYKGSGTPTLFTTVPQINKFLKAKDTQGRRLYANKAEVADALGVSAIVVCEPMKEVPGLIGIIVNLDDYNVGTDKGGEINLFDDFDIDYNQQKYLMETRMSGALVRPKSALIIMTTASTAVSVDPVKPSFVSSTGVVTIPNVTGVVYKGADGTTTLTAGAQTALTAGSSTTVYAVPASGYYFPNTGSDSWTFKRPA